MEYDLTISRAYQVLLSAVAILFIGIGCDDDPAVVAPVSLNGDWVASATIVITEADSPRRYTNLVDSVRLSVNFTIGNRVVSGFGFGSQLVSFDPGENCRVAAVSTWDFPVTLFGTVAEGRLDFVMIPLGEPVINFELTCAVGDADIGHTYSHLGSLVGSLLSTEIGYNLIARQDSMGGDGSGLLVTDIQYDYHFDIKLIRR